MKTTLSSIRINEIVKTAKKAGISARKLYLHAGLLEETVRRWRKGIHEPGADRLNRLEQAFEYLMKRAEK